MSSVDVIVPCYRYGHLLRECVESVITQSGTSVRVLIIDDASPDNTAEVAADLVKEDPRVIFLRHAVNRGHIATYNEGIEWVSADYMLLLSADDYLLPGALSRSANLMDAYPEVGFTFGKVIVLNDSGSTRQTKIVVDDADKVAWRILGGLEFIELSGPRSIVSTPAAVVRTELQKRLGGYRPELPHAGDLEMWLRLAAHSSVGIVEAYQAVHRRHANNMSLLYRAEYKLPDVKQRKAALDCFFDTCCSVIEDPLKLQRKFFRSLAYDALCYAIDAFDMGEMGASKALSEFALSVSPEIRRSLPWIRLACQYRLGCGSWRFLRPAVSVVRGATMPLKRMARRLRNRRIRLTQ
jgi:GT2 family glycosyltransferase